MSGFVKADAEQAFDFFIQAYGVKYDKATERLIKDRDRLLSFYDFPAEHWKHIRTTNPIESTFATVRHRTVKTKGCLSRKTALAMAFKLILSARRKWRKLDGSNQLAELIDGVAFKDGIKQIKTRHIKPPGSQEPVFRLHPALESRFAMNENPLNGYVT
jgi:putative transposase